MRGLDVVTTRAAVYRALFLGLSAWLRGNSSKNSDALTLTQLRTTMEARMSEHSVYIEGQRDNIPLRNFLLAYFLKNAS